MNLEESAGMSDVRCGAGLPVTPGGLPKYVADFDVTTQTHACPHCYKKELIVKYRSVADGYDWKADCKSCWASTINHTHSPSAVVRVDEGMVVVPPKGSGIGLPDAIYAELKMHLIQARDPMTMCLPRIEWLPARGMIVAFDGVTGAGKTTLIGMLLADSANAVVVRENEYDPIRPLTKAVYRVAHGLDGKLGTWEDVVKTLHLVPKSDDDVIGGTDVKQEALDYANHYNRDERSHALLAYLFTCGRTFTNRRVKELAQRHNVILDRWQLSGWVGQSYEGHGWWKTRELNKEMGILWPDVQFIVSCPPENIAERRAIRAGQGVVKPYQIPVEKEGELINTYRSIYDELRREGIRTNLIENNGKSTEDAALQMKQAYVTYRYVRSTLSANDYTFKKQPLELNGKLQEAILKRQRAE